jgi:hypothetical protein
MRTFSILELRFSNKDEMPALTRHLFFLFDNRKSSIVH